MASGCGVLRLIGSELRRSKTVEDPYLAALAARGLSPGSYSSKPRIELDPEMPATMALRRIIARLLDSMKANEAGLEAARDKFRDCFAAFSCDDTFAFFDTELMSDGDYGDVSDEGSRLL